MAIFFLRIKMDLLVNAIRQDNMDAFLALLGQGNININGYTPEGTTPLIEAIMHDNIEMVRRLIEAGARVNKRPRNTPDDMRMTPLMFAVGNRNREMVRLLVENRANVNATDKYKDTALTHAILSHHDIGIAGILLDHGANINVKDVSGNPLLLRSIFIGPTRIDIIRFLIDNGANINARSDGNITPLVAAVESGSVALVRLLLEQVEIIIDAVSNAGTAIEAAVSVNAGLPIIRLLLKAGADFRALKDSTEQQVRMLYKDMETNLLVSAKKRVVDQAHIAIADARRQDKQSPPIPSVRSPGFLRSLYQYATLSGQNREKKKRARQTVRHAVQTMNPDLLPDLLALTQQGGIALRPRNKKRKI